jgi:hypothetical protein
MLARSDITRLNPEGESHVLYAQTGSDSLVLTIAGMLHNRYYIPDTEDGIKDAIVVMEEVIATLQERLGDYTTDCYNCGHTPCRCENNARCDCLAARGL